MAQKKSIKLKNNAYDGTIGQLDKKTKKQLKEYVTLFLCQ